MKKDIFTFLVENFPELLQHTAEHLLLVLISTSIAVVIGLPLGLLLTRRPHMSRLVLSFANIVQTIPSLALFGFFIPLPVLGGIGPRTAIIALILYALLPIIRNTVTGINSIDPTIREAARAMGMRERQVLLQVELPLAFSVILAGVRVATVTSIGVATIAAAIGAGGLGMYIFRGVSMVDHQIIMLGALPAALLALAADQILATIAQRFVPTGKY